MWFNNLLPSWRRFAERSEEGPLPAPRTSRRRAPPRQRFAVRVEILEDRSVPSTLTVTSTADDGSSGTLRSVIASAGPSDTIRFARDLRGDTITLTQGQLTIGKNLNIEGLGADKLAISGDAASRIFDVAGDASITIAGLTMTDGLATQGGGILNETGS